MINEKILIFLLAVSGQVIYAVLFKKKIKTTPFYLEVFLSLIFGVSLAGIIYYVFFNVFLLTPFLSSLTLFLFSILMTLTLIKKQSNPKE